MKTSIQISPQATVNSSNTILLMIVGARHCCFSLMGSAANELLSFDYYLIEDIDDYNTFFDNNDILRNKYEKVSVAYDFGESVFIPGDVYQADDRSIHLQAIYGREVHNDTIAETIATDDLQNIYRIPSKLRSSVQAKFAGSNALHFYSVLLKNYDPQQPSSMLVDFKTDNFTVITYRGNKFMLAQTFNYATPEDILYYLLNTCQQFELSQQEVRVTLSGLIEKDSAIYRELYKYFIHLEFGKLYNNVRLTEALKTHPEHYYSSISKLAACVS